jgi:hypothetical protein
VNLEKFLTFVTHHNESIIQWLFFGILLLAGTLIARSLFGKKEENQASGGDLHSALEKILAQTTKLESISVDGLKAGSPESAALVVALKADLATREKELTELKAKGGSDEATSSLGARIKELEAKLAEYEILEDDIADLSLYKEENARLKSELDRMKGGESAAPEPAPAAVEPPKGDDIVAEFAQAVDQKPEPTPEGADKIEVPDTGDPMADFESTVKLEKKLAAEPEAAPAPAPAAAKAAPAAAAAPSDGGPQAEADDLFAEFSAGGEEGGASLDTDKMMAEMAALVCMEPASDNALEESIDTEKMAAEATSFTKS